MIKLGCNCEFKESVLVLGILRSWDVRSLVQCCTLHSRVIHSRCLELVEKTSNAKVWTQREYFLIWTKSYASVQ